MFNRKVVISEILVVQIQDGLQDYIGIDDFVYDRAFLVDANTD